MRAALAVDTARVAAAATAAGLQGPKVGARIHAERAAALSDWLHRAGAAGVEPLPPAPSGAHPPAESPA